MNKTQQTRLRKKKEKKREKCRIEEGQIEIDQNK